MKLVRMCRRITAAVFVIFTPSVLAQGTCDCAPELPIDCRIDHEQPYIIAGCRAEAGLGWNWLGTVSSGRPTDTCVATAPLGYVVTEVVEANKSVNHGLISYSNVAPDTNYDVKEIIDTAYQDALDMSASLSDKDEKKEIQERIKQQRKEHLQIYETYKTNRQAVMVKASAYPQGGPGNLKQSWAKVEVRFKVRCIAPINIEEQIQRRTGLDKAKSAKTK
jgi:hypothetical protein